MNANGRPCVVDSLVVCDDSNMARKQVLRALPTDWPVSVTEAVNGRQAMDAIRQGLGQVVLLDLTMPEMDGYQVLSALRAEGLKAQVIVISGDVQDEAVRRVLELGALAFLKNLSTKTNCARPSPGWGY